MKLLPKISDKKFILLLMISNTIGLVLIAAFFPVQSEIRIQKEYVATPKEHVQPCFLSVCPQDDNLCLSIRILNYSISQSGKTECELLDEVCFSHGNLVCSRSPTGCNCIAGHIDNIT